VTLARDLPCVILAVDPAATSGWALTYVLPHEPHLRGLLGPPPPGLSDRAAGLWARPASGPDASPGDGLQPEPRASSSSLRPTAAHHVTPGEGFPRRPLFHPAAAAPGPGRSSRVTGRALPEAGSAAAKGRPQRRHLRHLGLGLSGPPEAPEAELCLGHLRHWKLGSVWAT